MNLIDPAYRPKIMAELEAIEANEDVKILFAIESGSRAWGFPSPDSDYDARFVYARKIDWYLSITPGRDVIELPIDDLLDINGWDLQKALGLLLKPNPVLLEWLNSPIKYMWRDDICDSLLEFSKQISHASACLYHYHSMGTGQYRLHLEGKDEIKLKKLLYVLRPAMAIRWIRHHPDIFPPMNFREVMQGCDLDVDIQRQIDDILARKAETKELGFSPTWPDINAFCQKEFEWAKSHAKDYHPTAKTHLHAANDLFRSILKQVWA